jgi:GH25 family lysozyme M1 (1,4-beta-N-acetylmuramidase)
VPTDPPTSSTLKPNPFERDDFVKNGQFISCKTEKTAIGVDISSWQENVDFVKLKAAGVDYVMIRAGFRSTAWAGTLKKDQYVEQNYLGAKAAGLKVGFYFYSQARNVKEAEEEARFLLDIVKGWDVDLPLVCDWEYTSGSSRVENVSRRNATDSVKAFCEVVKAAGYMPMFYTAEYLVKYKLYIEELSAYGIWYADYRNYLSTSFRADMWQYTAKGRVDGIQGYADINVLFLENSIFADKFKD